MFQWYYVTTTRFAFLPICSLLVVAIQTGVFSALVRLKTTQFCFLKTATQQELVDSINTTPRRSRR